MNVVSQLGVSVAPIIIVLLVWTLFWKGLALWQSARLGHKKWFIALLVINTMGLLEIYYLYVVVKKPPTF